MKKLTTLIAVLSIFGVSSLYGAEDEHIFKVLPNALQWGSNPALPKDVQVSVVFGDPSKDGAHVMRIKIPAGTKVAPHWHPITENITVLSGTFNIGSGDTFDEAKGVNIPTGGFISVPPKHHHFAWVTEDTVVQLNNYGQWQLIYVNPKDDPKNQ